MAINLSAETKTTLLRLARQTIADALQHKPSAVIIPTDYASELQLILSSFVTLHSNGQLRGCIGSLEGREPLVMDVANHAYAAAFQDPRFPSLQADELNQINIEISVLSPQTPIHCRNEQELLAALQIGIDGLTLEDGPHCSTFLPTVWQQLRDKQTFVRQLKQKAGLPTDYWSPTLTAKRYSTLSFAEAH